MTTMICFSSAENEARDHARQCALEVGELVVIDGSYGLRGESLFQHVVCVPGGSVEEEDDNDRPRILIGHGTVGSVLRSVRGCTVSERVSAVSKVSILTADGQNVLVPRCFVRKL